SGIPGSSATGANKSPAPTGGSTSTWTAQGTDHLFPPRRSSATRSCIWNKWSVPGLVLALLCAAPGFAADPKKVFRMAFEIAETTFDPQKVADLYSNMIIDAVMDTPVKYDYLARPLKLKPNTLAALPEVTDNGQTITMRVKPGIYFNDDPAFGGK